MFSTNRRSFAAQLFSRRFSLEPLEPRILLSSSNPLAPALTVSPAINIAGSPSGLSPAMIKQAYDLNNLVFSTGHQTVQANGAGQTIAIIDAFGDPNIVSDVQTFDANFGLPNDNSPGHSFLTVATPQGSVSTDTGWALEQSLDVEWGHAIAPMANILLVETPSATFGALTGAVTWAAQQPGVVAISMSWGDAPEFSAETQFDSAFTTPAGHAGITYVASSGDNAVPNYPSTSVNVLAVGGTTLTVDNSGNFLSESPWSESGGGHSPFEGTNKPDVAYDGDPATGFLVFDSTPNNGRVGWQIVAGTSAGAPQWAAIIALADQGRSVRSLSSLTGADTQATLQSLPSSDFNPETASGFVGRGSPIGQLVISALVGGNITQPGLNPSPGSPDQLVFDHQPTNATAGTALSPAVTVLVEDSDGSVVSSDNSNVTISVQSGPGAASGTLTVAAVNGVATFSNLSFDTTGTYTLTASDGLLFSSTSSSFSITAGPPSQLAFVNPPLTAWQFATPILQVAVEDAGGNVVTTSNAAVSLSVINNTSGVPVVGPFTTQAVNGIATFSAVPLNNPGLDSLQASSGSLTDALAVVGIETPITQQFLFSSAPLSAAAINFLQHRIARQSAPPPISDFQSSARAANRPATAIPAAAAVATTPNFPTLSFPTPFSSDQLILFPSQDPNDLLASL